MDIVERLKADTLRSGTWADTGNLMLEAAEEIERLRSGGVTAWAVVDKDGVYDPNDVFKFEDKARDYAKFWDDEAPRTAPHRIIRVRIVPAEGKPTP